ncbi:MULTISPECIES: MazG-like family protein [unclassified Streptomyces]|uniref:MazG-like family protein n=1 Tax=unclassified Streptomyces TaxID=2593676 RepID=UPI001654C8DC|nr:MazG-like family protein [Streptomyces sp. CB02980]MCB8905053.1 MazG-like family protein [Streptomyces sp. CB02980]
MRDNDPWDTIRSLAALFSEFDAERGLAAEEQWTLQVLKLAEEVGEAAQAVIGVRAANPRKGRSHDWEQVQEEVVDAVITGMVALARMRPDDAPEFFASVLARKSARFLPRTDPHPHDGDPVVTSR